MTSPSEVCHSTHQSYDTQKYIPGTGGLEKSRALLFSIAKKVAWSSMRKRDYSLVYALLMDPEFGIVEAMIPHVGTQSDHMFKAGSRSDPDTPTMAEAMRGPNR